MKINNDAYYTPTDLANELWNKAVDLIGAENITYVIEPSCGRGAFMQHPRYRVNLAVDIATECYGMADTFVKGDFLNMEIPRYKGALVIGNPPYGERLYLAQRFFRHAATFADYIAFILPISQLNNTQSLYEFDLIHSEDLGVRDYSGRRLHCCFNVYLRPAHGLNKKPSVANKLVRIIRNDMQGYDKAPYDVRICGWGNGSAGKILTEGEHYSCEYKIKVLDESRKTEIVDFIKSYPWVKKACGIAMRRLKQFHIHSALAERFGAFREPDLFDITDKQ